MFRILPFLLIASAVYLVFRIVRRILKGYAFQQHPPTDAKFDSSKEVKNVFFKEEDIQDAKYKDIK
jgi:hypothetical protein